MASVAALFTVPYTKARKKYLDELAQGMDTTPQPATAAATAGTPSGGGGRGAGKVGTTEAGGGTRNHDAVGRRKRGPFPPGHYAASRAELEANEFPLLRPGAGGALEPPPGFVATQPSGTPSWEKYYGGLPSPPPLDSTADCS